MSRNVSAERGAALLDEKVPGWEDRIDLDRLDLSQDCKCVLGQLHRGDYYKGARKVGVDTWYDEIRYGFVPQPSTREVRGRWDNLTRAWTRLILARRA